MNGTEQSSPQSPHGRSGSHRIAFIGLAVALGFPLISSNLLIGDDSSGSVQQGQAVNSQTLLGGKRRAPGFAGRTWRRRSEEALVCCLSHGSRRSFLPGERNENHGATRRGAVHVFSFQRIRALRIDKRRREGDDSDRPSMCVGRSEQHTVVRCEKTEPKRGLWSGPPFREAQFQSALSNSSRNRGGKNSFHNPVRRGSNRPTPVK